MMSAPIDLSHNELKYLLKTVFEGQFGHDHDISAMAEQIVWLEACGLKGVSHVLDGVDGTGQPASSIPLSQLDEGLWEFDGRGQSCLTLIDGLCDLMRDITTTQSQCRLRVLNIKTPEIIMASTRCAKHGFNIQARWPSGLARILSGQNYPEIFDVAPDEECLLIFTTSEETLPDLPSGKRRRLSAEDLREAFDASLEKGLNIRRQDYERLTALAARILVPASEASRRGAGE